MRRAWLLFAISLLATPAFAQRVQTDNAPQHVICDSGCGSGGVGASVDISSVAGNIIVGPNVPVAFSTPPHVIIDSLPAGGAGLTDTELRASAVSVNFTNTSIAATNAGTFAVQAAQSGTWNIGSVTSLPAITFASPQHTIVDSGAVTFSNTTLAVTNTGTFAVQATLAAETTKVIGTINIAAAQSLSLSGTLPAFTAIPTFKIDQTTPGTTNAVAVTNSFALEATLQSVKTAVETIDNFISGSRGLVTEDNSALIKAALDTLNAAVSTAAKQDTGNTSLGSIKTNTDPLVASGAGGYVRQDSTATIAKESGGNLATIATNTTSLSTAANQTTELGYLATIAALSKAEDGAHVDGETGVLSFAVRNDLATTLTSADLDRSPIAVDSHGHLNVRAMGRYGPTGSEQILQTSQAGVLLVISQPAATLPLPLCNAVRRYSCQPKTW